MWRYLGKRGQQHYYVSRDKSAGALSLLFFEDSWEYDGDGNVYMRIIDEACERARSAPYVYVRLPRDSPPLLHLKSGGELYLALDDWSKPQDVLLLGRLPYSGPETKCEVEYALDIARRERAWHAYIRVLRAHCTLFCFQFKNSTVVIAERAW